MKYTLKNRDCGSLGHVAWNNTYNDTAHCGGTAGLVTAIAPLDVNEAPIPFTVDGLDFSASDGSCRLAGDAIDFGTGECRFQWP